MSGLRRLFFVVTLSLSAAGVPVFHSTAGAAVPAVASSLSRAILKFFGKEGSQQATEYLSKRGGQEAVERVAANAAREGGDAAVERVSKLASQHGPEAIAAMDNTPSVLPILGALDELPESEVRSALVKLSAGAQGRELARATERFGAAAIRSELKHPGVGLVLVRELGDDGADLASRLSTDQAIAIGRHAEDLAKLPAAQRTGILSMIRQDTERMVGFLGRFVEANPGKTLFTVAATTVILAEPDRILGGDEIVFDAQGNPIVIRKSGLAGRTIEAGGAVGTHLSERYLRPTYFALLAFVATFAFLWTSIKLWHLHRRERLKSNLIAEKPVDGESGA